MTLTAAQTKTVNMAYKQSTSPSRSSTGSCTYRGPLQGFL